MARPREGEWRREGREKGTCGGVSQEEPAWNEDPTREMAESAERIGG